MPARETVQRASVCCSRSVCTRSTALAITLLFILPTPAVSAQSSLDDGVSTLQSGSEQLQEEPSQRSKQPYKEGTLPGGRELVDGGAGVAPEDRTYTFDIKEGTYRQLVEDFAWQTGLGLIGEPPRCGSIDLVTSEELSFHEALARVRMILFDSSVKAPYWLLRHDTHLEVLHIDDALEVLPDDRMFRTVEEFQTADLSPDELALVIFTPPSGSLSDLNLVRDFMPEYVRVAALEDQNAVTIFALVKDIEKYLYLSELFGGGSEDPRTLEIIDVEHILPSKALEKLESLMDLDTGRRHNAAGRKARQSRRSARTPRRKGRTRTLDPFTEMGEPEISVVADDVRRVIIVRAMAETIDEIRLLLPYLDVDTSTDFDPVIIRLEHASAEELMPVLRQMLEASMGATADTIRDRRRQPRRSRKSRKSKRNARSATVITVGDISLMAHPTNDAIIVMGGEDDTDLVREFVEVLDVKDRSGPIRIEVEYVDANVLSNTLAELLGGKRRRGSAGLELPVIVPDVSGEAIWVEGSEKDLDAVREIVALMDSAGSAISLHVARLTNQRPSLVARILRDFDDEIATSKSGSRSSRRRGTARSSRRRSTRRSTRSRRRVVSKFTPDDEQNRLFVLCTEEEWEQYLPIIKQLEDVVDDEQPFARLTLTHISPQEAIDKLTTLFVNRDDPIRFAVAENDILVLGAGPSQIEAMESLLAEIDKSSQQVQRTFEIQHTDPAELMRTIQTLMGDEISTRPTRGRRGRSRSRRAPSRTAASGENLTIVQIASQLVVRTTPAKMEQVARLINELDVAQQDIELRVYDDFPPRTDIESIANTVSAVVNGTVRDARSRRRRRNQPPPRVTLIPQPASRRLIVRGDPTAFAQIEELLSALTGEQQADDFEDLTGATFFDVEYADSAELVDAIRPLLNLKVQEFIATGQLDDEPIRSVTRALRRAGRRSRSAGENPYYYMAPDTRNQRIVLTAAQVVLDEATRLIEEFDLPGDAERMTVRTVELTRTDSATVIAAMGEILGAPMRGARRKRGRRPSRPGTVTTDSLTIRAAPGGGGVVLRGFSDEVEQAAGLIEQLDALSTSGRGVNVYHVEHADLENLADFIMSVVDSSTSQRGGSRSRRAPQRLPKEDEFSTSRTWRGRDVYIQADLIGRVLIVAASQSKLSEVDGIVARLDTEEVSAALNDTVVPKLLYELEHVEASDAAFELEMILGTLWEPSDEVPTVEASPFGNMLIIRYLDEDRFPEIEELIAKYVDKPDLDRDRIIRRLFTVPRGMTAQEAVRLLEENHPELGIEVQDISETEDYGIERLRPRKTPTP